MTIKLIIIIIIIIIFGYCNKSEKLECQEEI